jgi:hypothetical protein
MGSVLNQERELSVGSMFSEINRDFSEMQTISLLADSHDKDLACLAFKEKLRDMDSNLWDLGSDLEKFSSASEEFKESHFYTEQKRHFNENEVLYYLLLKNVVDTCNLSKQTILYFYADEDTCSKCDDQSFILRDIILEDERVNEDRELSIFSLDTDVDVKSIGILSNYYNLSNYPCMIINDEEPICGIQSRDEIIDVVCKDSPNLNICSS